MILVLCNNYKEYQHYVKSRLIENLELREKDFEYAYCSDHVQKVQSAIIKVIRIISWVEWFTFREYFELIRRIR